MKTSSGSIKLTAEYFKVLLEKIHQKFLKEHNLSKLPKAFQLYGYGSFDSKRANLKADFEKIGTQFINGKYLYDKSRQIYKGLPVIKINKYYKEIILLFLDYENFREFIDKNPLSKEEVKEQQSLLYNEQQNRTFYYLSYYYGEDNNILKGLTVISENFKKIKHTYVYPQDDGTLKTHHNFGNIIRREDTLHMNTKTLLDGKLVEGGNEIYYIGHSNPVNTKFLIGTYCTFDIYTQTVAGKSILEKCDSKEEMEEQSKNNTIPPYIAQEIRKSRIINPSIVPKHFMEISEKSPYASIYGLLPGNYKLYFELNHLTSEELEFNIAPNDFKVICHTPNVYFENESFQLLNKGSIVHFSFKLVGIIALDAVDIYFKSYFLRKKNEKEQGVFSGVNKENQLVSGDVVIQSSNS